MSERNKPQPDIKPYNEETISIVNSIIEEINSNPKLPKAIRERDPNDPVAPKTIYEHFLHEFIKQGTDGVSTESLKEILSIEGNLNPNQLGVGVRKTIYELRSKLHDHNHTIQHCHSPNGSFYSIIPLKSDEVD